MPRFQHREGARLRSKIDQFPWEHEVREPRLTLRDWLRFIIGLGLIVGILHTLVTHGPAL